MNSENLRNSLDSGGFNLLATLDSSNIDDPSLPDVCASLLLIGSGGNGLWQKMPVTYLAGENPVDDYSTDFVENLMHRFMPDGGWQILFPAKGAGEPVPNLQRLGSLAGWHYDSPLGNGINQKYGLWFAYRVVVGLSRPLEPDSRQAGSSSCLSCADTPCISACPATALTIGKVPNLGLCMGYRTAVASACAQTCLARVSCPVAPQWRYSDAQINYFYGRSLLSLREWVTNNAGLSQSD